MLQLPLQAAVLSLSHCGTASARQLADDSRREGQTRRRAGASESAILVARPQQGTESRQTRTRSPSTVTASDPTEGVQCPTGWRRPRPRVRHLLRRRSISSALAAVTVALPVLQVPGSEPEPRLELQVRLEAAMKQVWVEQTPVD